MDPLPRYAARFLGVITILCAAGGLWWNATVPFDIAEADLTRPYSLPLLILMWIIYTTCYVMLIVFGVQFIRLRMSGVFAYTQIMLLEIAWSTGLLYLPMVPAISNTGIFEAAMSGTFGVMFQVMCLLPIWGPLLAHWVKRHLESEFSMHDQSRYSDLDEWIESGGDWVRKCFSYGVFAFLTFIAVSMIGALFGLFWIPFLWASVLILLSPIIIPRMVQRWRMHRRNGLRRIKEDRLKADKCPTCQYDLRGLAESRCPECGAPFDVSQIMKADHLQPPQSAPSTA